MLQRVTVEGVPGGTGQPRDDVGGGPPARSGRDLSGIRFYEIFAVFKIAVVIQQIYFRYVQGQTTDARFASFGARVEFLAQHAASLAALP